MLQAGAGAWGERAACEAGREADFDAVHGGNVEMAGAHRDVRHAEVEERIGGCFFVERIQAATVVRQRGFERLVEQVGESPGRWCRIRGR